jgi:hypothetical protein
MKSVFRLIAGLVAVGGLTISFFHGANASEADVLRRLVLHFSMFTNLTNTVVMIALLIPVLMPIAGLGRFLSGAGARTAIAGYIIFVGIAYHFLLANVWQPQGWTLVAMIITHYVVPVLFVVDWVVFTSAKAGVAWSNAVTSLVYPIPYIAWTLFHGAKTGWYPYHFLNVNTLGYKQVLINTAGFLATLLALQFLLTGVGKLLGETVQSEGPTKA